MQRRLIFVLLLVAFALVAAACGDTSGVADPISQPLQGEPDTPVVTSSTNTVGADTAPPTDDTAPAGSGSQPVDEATAPTAAAEPQPPPPSDLPEVVVVDLGGGEQYLPALAPSDRPILLWFWAPH